MERPQEMEDLVLLMKKMLLEIKPKRRLTTPYFLEDVNQNLLSHVQILPLAAVLMDSSLPVDHSMKAVWSTRLVRIQDMVAAETDLQLLRVKTLKVVPRTHVKTHCLGVVMMERQQPLELVRRASAVRIRNVSLVSLAVVLMEEHLPRVPRNKAASHVQRRCSYVMLVRRLNLDVALTFRMQQLDLSLKVALMRMVRSMKTVL